MLAAKLVRGAIGIGTEAYAHHKQKKEPQAHKQDKRQPPPRRYCRARRLRLSKSSTRTNGLPMKHRTTSMMMIVVP